jgi:hypothetical protein
MLKFFFQRWQNLNYGVFNEESTTRIVRTGGYRFHFEPGTEPKRGNSVSYADLYPVINKYVFVLGGIEMRMSGNNLQYMTISIPLTVGSMTRLIQTVSTEHLVTYSSNVAGLPPFEKKYPGYVMFPVANIPPEWLRSSSLGFRKLDHWVSNVGVPPAGSTSPTTIWYPGDVVDNMGHENHVSGMTASWVSPESSWIQQVTYNDMDDDEYIWDVSGFINEVSSMRYWIISGGGGGGRGDTKQGRREEYPHPGAGGGSGSYSTGLYAFSLQKPTSVSFIVGKGGDASSYGSQSGGDGGSSAIYFNYGSSETGYRYSHKIIEVEGGYGGRAGIYEPTEGGKGGAEGGATGSVGDETHGGDGAGIPALSEQIMFGGTPYTIPASIGGKGGVLDGLEVGGDGEGYGAGGGGGAPEHGGHNGGSGSPGYILVAFYR